MPRKPLKPCNRPGCANLTIDTYCEQHRQERYAYDRYRGTRTQRGYDNHWIRYSQWYRKQNPLCVMCLEKGIVKPSEHVDHITPVRGGQSDPLFWEPSNHQALCHECHSRKTRLYDM